MAETTPDLRQDVADLTRSAGAFQRAQAAVVATRLDLNSAIVKAAGSGVKQADIVRITGYTRETVRRIVEAARKEREAAIEAAERLAVLDTWPTLLEKVDAEAARLRGEAD